MFVPTGLSGIVRVVVFPALAGGLACIGHILKETAGVSERYADRPLHFDAGHRQRIAYYYNVQRPP